MINNKSQTKINREKKTLSHISVTAKNTVILPNFMLWKFYRKAQFPHSFGRFANHISVTAKNTLISPKWCGNFVGKHSFRIVSGDSLSIKFPHQEIN